MKKKILAVLTAILALSLTACAAPTAESVLTKMGAASAKQSAQHAVWTMDLSAGMKMDTFDMDTSMKLGMEGDTRADSSAGLSETAVKMNIDMMFLNQDMDMLIYTGPEDETHTAVYTKVGDAWFKTVTEGKADETTAVSLTDLGDFMKQFTLAEEKETVGDHSCYRLSGELPVQEMIDKMASLGLADSGTEMLDADIFKDRSFMTDILVDEKSFLPIKILMKLTQPAEGADSSIVSEDGVSVSLDVMDMTIDLDYPESVDITIPEEAKNAIALDPDELGSAIAGEQEEEAAAEPVGSLYDTVQGAGIVKEFKDPDRILFETEGFSVSVDKAYTDDSGLLYVDFAFENNTDKPVSVGTDYVSLNGIMLDDNMYDTIPAGGGAATLTITTASENGIEQPGTLKAIVSAMDPETGEFLFATEPLTIKLGDGPDLSAKEGGQTVYEDDNVCVIKYEPEEDEYSHIIPLCVINKSDENVSYESTNVMIEGVEMNCYTYTYAFAGNIAYTELFVEKSELQDKQLDSPAGLKMKFAASAGGADGQEYRELFETGEIPLWE